MAKAITPRQRPVVGFHCAHELWSPRALLDLLKRAERAGFTAASCSDHLMPWSERDAHSGFAWSWLGAALEATSMSLGTVCAPGQRYHPAVVAQAVATLDQMYPRRFWLAVGSGEALNEHITGASWPPKPQRNARLRESVDIMRALWSGEGVQQHVDWLLADVELGYEHLYLHNVGRDQERFIDACGSTLIPAVAAS